MTAQKGRNDWQSRLIRPGTFDGGLSLATGSRPPLPVLALARSKRAMGRSGKSDWRAHADKNRILVSYFIQTGRNS